MHRFEQEGVEGLKDKPERGRKSSLSGIQKQALSNPLLSESLEDHENNSETWTGPMLIDWIKSNFEIEFKKAHIYNIVKHWGSAIIKQKDFILK